MRAWDLANRLFWDWQSGVWDSWDTPAAAADRANSVVAWLQALGVPTGAKVLDAGCATGAMACALALAGYESTGLDLSPAMLRRAAAKARAAGCQAAFRVGSLDERLPFPEGAFDVVVCIHTIQCVKDRAQLWREFVRILAPGGIAAIEAKAPGTPTTRPVASGAWARIRFAAKRYASGAVAHVPLEHVLSELTACGFVEPEGSVSNGSFRVSARGRTT